MWGTVFIVLGVVAVGLYAVGSWLAPSSADDKRRERAARGAERERQRSSLVCPHCQVAGEVSPTAVSRKQGISGGKATGALFTGGISMLATGLSRKQTVTQMRCGNCGTRWDVA